MNLVDEHAFNILEVMVNAREENYKEIGGYQFKNKWLQENTGLSPDDLNETIDYLQEHDAVLVFRGGFPFPYRFAAIEMKAAGKHLYYEFKSQKDAELMNSGATHEEKPSNPAKVFVVYGRNAKAREALFQFLHSIGLKPIEWQQAIRATGKAAPYIGEVLDAAFSEAQAVVVLMTPDDFAFLRDELRERKEPPHETQPTPQARPNVLFEAGMALGRHPDRTILVELGELRPFSDVGGRHTIKLNNTTQKRQDLAERLEIAGCPVDLRNRDWHTAGDFDAALEGL